MGFWYWSPRSRRVPVWFHRRVQAQLQVVHKGIGWLLSLLYGALLGLGIELRLLWVLPPHKIAPLGAILCVLILISMGILAWIEPGAREQLRLFKARRTVHAKSVAAARKTLTAHERVELARWKMRFQKKASRRAPRP